MTLPVGAGIQTGHVQCPSAERERALIEDSCMHTYLLEAGLWARSLLSLLVAVGGFHSLIHDNTHHLTL